MEIKGLVELRTTYIALPGGYVHEIMTIAGKEIYSGPARAVFIRYDTGDWPWDNPSPSAKSLEN